MNLLRTALLCLLLAAPLAHAHQQPNTSLLLDVAADRVTLDLHVPLTELELAFGHNVTLNPEHTLPRWRPDFETYLASHIRPVTDAGQPWSLRIGTMRIAHAEQSQSGPFQEVIVNLTLIPPPAADPRNFTLNYDLILHQVVTHKALVSIHRDWAAGRTEPAQLGVIAVNTGNSRIDPLPVRLGTASWWTGFTAMVRLGTQHIREGTDHLLFLLVLLLPATLLPSGPRWGTFAGTDASLRNLLRIVTAFTLGHSVTLLAGALRWLSLPQQPVEVLIACSILVTAIHAVRPFFAGSETHLAAAFGLVHGLAFATVLADLNLRGPQLALSILGFNLGIELMQLFVVALTIPWLILLSATPAHPWFRLTGSAFAAIASLGWILNRISGESNGVERAMAALTRFSPLGILLLASVAVPAYLFTTFTTRTPQERATQNAQ